MTRNQWTEKEITQHMPLTRDGSATRDHEIRTRSYIRILCEGCEEVLESRHEIRRGFCDDCCEMMGEK